MLVPERWGEERYELFLKAEMLETKVVVYLLALILVLLARLEAHQEPIWVGWSQWAGQGGDWLIADTNPHIRCRTLPYARYTFQATRRHR